MLTLTVAMTGTVPRTNFQITFSTLRGEGVAKIKTFATAI
jgi:hypothetical protein